MSSSQATTDVELGRVVGRELSTAVVLFHEAVGRRLGLSATERKILDVLDRLGPVRASELAAHTGLTSGAITGIIDRLTAAGHVRREPNPEDRRSVIITPLDNPAARRVTADAFTPLGNAIVEFSGHFRPKELEVISRYLTGLTAILRDETARLNQELPSQE